MPRIHRSAQDYVRALSDSRTQKQIAALLGISERTVRRYKRGDTKPHDKNVIQRIEVAGRKEVKKQLRKGYAVAPVPIPIKIRSIQNRDKFGRIIPGSTPSDWVNFVVEGRPLQDIFDLIQQHMNRGFVCQMIVEVTSGPEKGKHLGTRLVDGYLDRWSDFDIWQFINSVLWQEYSGDDREPDPDEDDDYDDENREEDFTKAIPNKPITVGFIFEQLI
jgi:transcriptional regulator with XRE-family HTH domain